MLHDSPLNRPTEAITDLSALSFNFRSVKKFLGDRIKYMAVVKANAYGHGAVETAKQLEADGVDWFGVALFEEAIELRNSGITKPILCLGGVWPGQEFTLIRNNITPTILNVENAELINTAANETNQVVNVHLKVDTGMGRVGVRADELSEFLDLAAGLPHIRIDGVMTHFATADDLSQNDYTDAQISEFNKVVDLLRSRGIDPTFIDAANSPGTFTHPEARYDMVRLGGALYGMVDDILPKETAKPELKPVLSLVTRIAQIKQIKCGDTLGYGRTFTADKDMTIATIPIGYNDGYRRGLSNMASALLKGVAVPVVGRISMDWTMLDVTEVKDVKLGDKVTLIGADGENSIRVEELSQILGTISYEITCGLSSRIARRTTHLGNSL